MRRNSDTSIVVAYQMVANSLAMLTAIQKCGQMENGEVQTPKYVNQIESEKKGYLSVSSVLLTYDCAL